MLDAVPVRMRLKMKWKNSANSFRTVRPKMDSPVNTDPLPVVQVMCETADVNSLRPYLKPKTELNGGSGVIIDSKNGIIVTNAHVTANSQMIQVFSSITGKTPLRCNLVSIIHDKDLSLIRIIDEDLKQLLDVKPPEQLDAKLIDHLQITQGSQLFAAGFPLGTRLLQITSGCLSGLSTPDSFVRITQYEDSYARNSTFIATSAGLNFGMSGGGLFTTDGHLVGIITAGLPSANQIGYAIPSRIVYANYLLMLHNILPRVPTFNFRWSNINQATFDRLTGKTKLRDPCKGILIRKVLKDSIFHGVLEKGDLLQRIEFQLPSIEEDSMKKMEDKVKWVSGCIEPLGDLTVEGYDKKFSISEVSDYIVYGSPLKLHFIRKGKTHVKNVNHVYKKTNRVRGVYPLLESLNWMLIDGICIQDITLNTLAECPRYKYIDEIDHYDELLHNPSVIVTHVSPSSSAGSLSLFNIGDILTHVNGEKVRSLKEVKQLLSKIAKDAEVTLEGDRGQFVVVKLTDDGAAS